MVIVLKDVQTIVNGVMNTMVASVMKILFGVKVFVSEIVVIIVTGMKTLMNVFVMMDLDSIKREIVLETVQRKASGPRRIKDAFVKRITMKLLMDHAY